MESNTGSLLAVRIVLSTNEATLPHVGLAFAYMRNAIRAANNGDAAGVQFYSDRWSNTVDEIAKRNVPTAGFCVQATLSSSQINREDVFGRTVAHKLEQFTA